MTPSKTGNQVNAETNRDQNQTSSAADFGTVRDNNKQYNGAVQDTDYYKNQVESGTAGTTQGYTAAKRNLKQSMEAAGVTGDSGVSLGNTTALDAQQAHDLATVRTNAFADTANQQRQANAQDINIGDTESEAGLGYAKVGDADENNRQAQGNANKMALAKAISTAAFGV